jgi:hypothetical protein
MNVAKEEWKPIKGYEGFYEVSDQGRIKSVARTLIMKNGVRRPIKEKIINGSAQASGYLNVTLSKNGTCEKLRIHRIVAEAFVPNPDHMPEVNHKDENKQNNAAANLEWCDRKYNNIYGTAKLRSAITQGKPVLQILDGEIVNAWPSAGMAAAFTNATQGGISSCCRGEMKTSGGYEWKLAPWAKQ